MAKTLSILIILTAIYSSQGLECSTPNVAKTRVFDSLLAYQHNKVPFNPTRGEWEGSNVEFSFNTVSKILKNTFVTYDSEAVISLRLSNKEIKEVDDGAFISLTCLRELYLDHNNVTSLTKDTFQNLEKLQILDLSYNKLEAVEDFVLGRFAKLKNLNLSHNQIKKFGGIAFANLTSLVYLNLEGNVMKKFSPDVFQPLQNLSILVLSWNNFLKVEPEKWLGLTKLQTLDLAGNGLSYFDTSYNFSFMSLKSLNLSRNYLTVLNVMGLRRHLPVLELIDLNDNPWLCDTLQEIVYELKDSRIKLPSRNYSTVGIQGIACSEVPRSTSTIVSTTFTTKKNDVWVNRTELERYVEKKIEDNNEELKSSIRSVRHFVIFVFAFLCVFILFEIIARTGICSSLVNKLRGGDDVYVDDGTDVENFRLLHR